MIDIILKTQENIVALSSLGQKTPTINCVCGMGGLFFSSVFQIIALRVPLSNTESL